MKATTIEFRLRMAINAAIIILGFWSPWIEALKIGTRISLIEWLAIQLSRLGIASFSIATSSLIILALFFALIAVVLRVAGTAWLGPITVNSINMVAGNMMVDGPYRFLRNPLYIGLWCMVAAMSFLMPASGALFAVALVTLFMFRLTFGEEAFLIVQLGQPYAAYLHAVPRFIPRLRGAPPRSGAKPHWLRAFVAELIPIGTLVGIIVFWRSYEIALAGRIILISFGASLVVSAFLPRNAVSSVPEKQ
jgi:protein-S-isoprenylcysteine O-methyltransferase Ste14